MLVLFDVDGTLLVGSDVPHFTAMRAALAEVFGVTPEEDDGVEKQGRTDHAIARDVAAAAGVAAARYDTHRDRVAAAWIRAFKDGAGASLRELAASGAAHAVAELAGRGAHVALVTGNLRPLAEAKLARAGLDGGVRFEHGGYGSDAEDRDALPPLARRRSGGAAGPWPREDTVLVGDTPRDIACARADGLRCVAVTTGHFGRDQLRGADAVIDRLSDLRRAIEEVLPGPVAATGARPAGGSPTG